MVLKDKDKWKGDILFLCFKSTYFRSEKSPAEMFSPVTLAWSGSFFFSFLLSGGTDRRGGGGGFVRQTTLPDHKGMQEIGSLWPKKKKQASISEKAQ